ncbi:MAG: ISNCY family transposase [Deltaproteobacteria bacterium]|nr:MAG: ISNCY family transposase [Deltaproteobacteria bacterium]
MRRDIIAMSQKERQRYHLLKMVVEGAITLRQASSMMGVSYRHAKRLKRKLVSEGARGLIHGNRGRPSARALHPQLSKRIIELSQKTYARFNDTHSTEKLNEVEGITVSRDTVRRLRRSNGIPPKRKRRARKHHQRRARKPQAGMMVLWDGSPHRWFGEDTLRCCLLASIDDATGELLGAFFIPYECSFGYMKLLEHIVKRYGIPCSIYQDRHGSLHRNDDHWTLEEQLNGEQDPTQVGGCLKSLGITALFALTPQAKGRVERLFGVFQDRLIAELELRNIKEMDAGNTFLTEHFIAELNRRFAVAPELSHKAWRRIPLDVDIETVISFRYQAVVGNDNAVRLGGMVIDIPEDPGRRGYAKAKVEVRQLLDGSWRVYYKDTLIAQTDPTPLIEPIRAKPRRKSRARAASEEQWVYMASAIKGGHFH